MSYFQTHQDLLQKAIKALHERTYFAAYPEHPKAYGEDAPNIGLEKWNNAQGKVFEGLIEQEQGLTIGEEASPYTNTPLGISYPCFDAETLINNANKAKNTWAESSIETRVGLLIESWERIKTRFFELAHATQHTTGQAFMMAFQASGPHAADRALESIAMGYECLTSYPNTTTWVKNMGKFDITLQKKFKAIPRGINLVIGCSTFPTWNTVPGLYAALVTGNVAIVKPHPGAVYPIAIVVSELQKILKENGFDPATVQLATDSSRNPITKVLAENPAVSLIDYTGGSAFGDYLETLPNKITFTEKAGVNTVIIDSCKNINDVLGNLAFSVSLYSGQMCTAPQNIFIPKNGVMTDEGLISFDDIVEKFSTAVEAIAQNPKMAAGTCGAIQNKATWQRVQDLSLDNTVTIRKGEALTYEEYPNARTCSVHIVKTDSSQSKAFSQELFGPIVIIVSCNDIQDALAQTQELCKKHGAITCAAYTTNADTQALIEKTMEKVFCPVSFNLTGFIWVNQHAAFSDFHVTGGNAAGNASFTSQEFVTKRFVWVGHRTLV